MSSPTIVATAACLALLWMSRYPGGLEWLLFPTIVAIPLALLIAPLLVAAWVLDRVARARHSREADRAETSMLADDFVFHDEVGVAKPRRPWPRNAWPSLLVVGATVLAIRGGLPTALAFRLSRRAFEEALVAAPIVEIGRPHGVDRFDRRLGFYLVDRRAADPRGGVYFRVNTTLDMIDTVSHGFAFRPNSRGTPFGRAGHGYRRITGDWYVFWASDDYY